MMSTINNEHKIHSALSISRISTYENASARLNSSALDLYAWNAKVSGALLMPLHICEVTIRNAVSDVLDSSHKDWIQSDGFKKRLPDYFKNDLTKAIDKAKRKNCIDRKGQVIAELTFGFWQHLFTKNYNSMWNTNLSLAFPNGSYSSPHDVYQDLEKIRKLRNRIAHHEPIFKRRLNDDLNVILKIVNFRCAETANWIKHHEEVTNVLKMKPR